NLVGINFAGSTLSTAGATSGGNIDITSAGTFSTDGTSTLNTSGAPGNINGHINITANQFVDTVNSSLSLISNGGNGTTGNIQLDIITGGVNFNNGSFTAHSGNDFTMLTSGDIATNGGIVDIQANNNVNLVSGSAITTGGALGGGGVTLKSGLV